MRWWIVLCVLGLAGCKTYRTQDTAFQIEVPVTDSDTGDASG